ncbi:Uncharacterized protein FWK35_00028362, partial [Aphis craccivora]
MSSQRSKRRRIQEELNIYNNHVFESENPEHLCNVVSTICYENINQSNKLILEIPNNINPVIPTQISTDKFETLFEPNLTPCNIQINIETNDYELSNNPVTENVFSISDMISKWAINYNISHWAINSLLSVTPGQYYHFGLKNGIERHFLFQDSSKNEIKLVIGIDDLPIAKSTTSQFWPILGYIRPYSKNVFPIGIYLGMEKPNDSNDFLKDFINEAKMLLKDGIIINNKIYTIVFDVFCCDVPAKSFILKIKGHCGYFSCTRCRVEGEHIENRTCFPYDESDLINVRTHDDYVKRVQEEHHTSPSISCISELIRFDVVSNFSLDYMHLVCLGTVKKIILLWMKGPLNVRLPSWKINEISENAVKLKTSFPCEFSRKPRKLDEINDFQLYGQLDNCSAFVFENYMQTLKSMLRKPDKPLEQIVLRMWSIVHFRNDNSVYAVPSTWMKKDICAWPKRKVKRFIETRIIPNKFDFDFLPARLLKGGIASLENAKQKLKRAEDSSNLSSADYIETSCDEKSSSEDNDDVFRDPSYSLPTKNCTSTSSSQGCSNSVTNFGSIVDTIELNTNKVSHLAVNNTEREPILSQLQKSPTDNTNNTLPVKRKLLFDETLLNDIIAADYFDLGEEEYIQTSASPFKVTNNYNILTPEKKLCISTSNKSYNLINTNLNKEKDKSEEINNINSQIHNTNITPRQSSDLINKKLRVVLKTKFDVELIVEKIDQLEHNLSTAYQTNHNNYTENTEVNDFWDILPIQNESQL